MLTTEQVKQIAEYMGLEVESDQTNKLWVDYLYRHTKWSPFDPASDDMDCMRVFKALVDTGHDFEFKIEDAYHIFKYGSWIASGETLNLAICLAYIAVMESK